jgi:hypothetical protein
MPRKKATMPQTESIPRRIEIAPEVLKKVQHGSFCCLCGGLLPLEGRHPDNIVPVCYLVTPEPRGKEQRQELGQLCGRCIVWATEVDVGAFKTHINTAIIWRCEDILKAASLFMDLELSIPPQHVWMAAAAERLANTRQSLTDLVRATGLEREEIVRRLIAKAKPEDLRANLT